VSGVCGAHASQAVGVASAHTHVQLGHCQGYYKIVEFANMWKGQIGGRLPDAEVLVYGTAKGYPRVRRLQRASVAKSQLGFSMSLCSFVLFRQVGFV
jgi:hypothetical protein